MELCGLPTTSGEPLPTEELQSVWTEQSDHWIRQRSSATRRKRERKKERERERKKNREIEIERESYEQLQRGESW